MELVYELRIGNLVSKSLKSGNGRTLIDKVGPQDIVRIYENISHFNYHPIPLTEEWLLKFGFGKEWETASGVTAKIINEECFYHKLSDLVIFMKSEIRDIDYPFVNIAKRDIKIQYVHQLQNLYFIITGKELNYSDVI